MRPDAVAEWVPPWPLDIGHTVAPLQHGAGDPAQRFVDGVLWRTLRTPEGPATLRVTGERAGRVRAAAWGAGAGWASRAVPDLLGARDDASGFVPVHEIVRACARRHRGLRLPRLGLVFEALVPAVLEQKVTGTEARRAWHRLVTAYGDPAPGPGPAGLRVVPSPSTWRRIPSWDWHRAGVDAKRAAAVRAAAEVAPRLEETLALATADAERRLRAVPGIGGWTAAEVLQRAHGCADAVSVGDFHLPALVGWALAGRPTDDGGMLALLAPYAPHRHRVVRLLEVSGFRKPRFGPRVAPREHRGY